MDILTTLQHRRPDLVKYLEREPERAVIQAIRDTDNETLRLLFDKRWVAVYPHYNGCLEDAVGKGFDYIGLAISLSNWEAVPIIIYSELGTYGYYSSRGQLPILAWLELSLQAKHRASEDALVSLLQESFESDLEDEAVERLGKLLRDYPELSERHEVLVDLAMVE